MNPSLPNGSAVGLRRAIILAALALHLPSRAARQAPAATQELKEDDFARIRMQHAGRPWVVHLWGESCSVCMAEMPQWPGLMRSIGLPLVLIQADASTGRAEPRLAAQGLDRFERWATRRGLDEFGRARIDPGWAGELPRTLLIAADGSTTAISGTVDPARLRRWAAETPRPR